ncbi:MAG: M56 family metallopeptidase [Candidatus Hydrogenedentes bacterium]|nr:M56 family metallopeptidase [Candidatus Hydrogenedentota bacterium]
MRYAIPEWLADAWAQLPLALLHTLWLGAVAVAVLALVLRRTSAERPELRYGVSLAALGFVVCGWLVVWAGLVYGAPAAGDSSVPGAVAMVEGTYRTDLTDQPDRTVAAADAEGRQSRTAAFPWRAWMANLWLAGVAAMAMRTAMLLRGAGQLRRASVPCDDEQLQSLLAELREALGVARDVALRISDRVDGPMVMGILWPAILLPAYVTTGVAPEHLRAALAHELAHIRRNDYLVNLFQLAVESLLFFNPAVWWISRQIRIEREACCDALAIRCTGGASEYARALAAFAARSLQPTAALAMSGGKASLVDRVRRILMPQDRPALRMSWFGLLAFLVVATAALAAFGGFSYLGVKLVAEAISPQERVERIEAINREFDEVEPENVSDIAVSGTIRTEDGDPLPEGTRVSGMNLFPSAYISHSCDIDGETFRCNRMKGSYIFIWAIADGYAPAILGPYATENGADLTGIEVVLTRGITGRIRVLDHDGLPVSDVDAMWQFPSGRGLTQGDKRTARTDTGGLAELAHTWDKPISLKLRKPGYIEFYEPQFAVAPNDVVEIEMRRMEPVILELRDAVTGEPVPDAELLVNSTRDVARNAISDAPSTLAVSDAAGTFIMDTLREDLEYWCYITAPGNRRVKLEEPIKVGQEPRTVALPPPLEVRGTVIVSPDESGTYPETVSLFADNPYEGGGYIESFGRNMEIPLNEGRGELVVDDLWPGVVYIEILERRERLEVHETIDDYVIDLRPHEGGATQQFRTMVLRVQTPKGDPEVNGSVRIHYLKQPGDNAYANAEVPIENGEARYQVPVPTEIGYDVLDSPGYWIESERSIPVEPGDEPFVVDLPSIPAGSIHGTVENSPEGPFGVSVVLVESPTGQDVFPLEVRSKRNERAYSLGPLPLGGTFIAAAHTKAAVALSEPITLTDRAPIQEVNLAFAPGVTVEGRVTYPDGSPANGLPIELSVSTKYSHGFSTAIGVTGANGEFRVEHVDFDQPVTYAIILKPDKEFVEVRHEFSRGERADVQLERGLVLDGRLLEDATGYPIPGVEVYAYSTQPETSIVDADAVTDREGRFRFTRMRDQVYQLGARNGANLREQVEARPGMGEPVELRVEMASWSTLRPVAPED